MRNIDISNAQCMHTYTWHEFGCSRSIIILCQFMSNCGTTTTVFGNIFRHSLPLFTNMNHKQVVNLPRVYSILLCNDTSWHSLPRKRCECLPMAWKNGQAMPNTVCIKLYSWCNGEHLPQKVPHWWRIGLYINLKISLPPGDAECILQEFSSIDMHISTSNSLIDTDLLVLLPCREALGVSAEIILIQSGMA